MHAFFFRSVIIINMSTHFNNDCNKLFLLHINFELSTRLATDPNKSGETTL